MKVADVIAIYEQMLAKGKAESFPDIWTKVSRVFYERARSMGIEYPDQCWKTVSGKAFEKITADFVSKIVHHRWFTNREITSSSWYRLTSDQRKLLSYQLERRCVGQRFDVSSEPDIVIFKQNRPKVIVSCKSSLRDRVNMDLFWAQLYREKGYIFTLVCAETTKSIGTCENPKKPRKLAEAIYDRLYIVNGDMEYCDVVKPFQDLEKDLMRWLG